MPNIYQLARQFRGELLAGERKSAAAMVNAYGQAWVSIKQRLDSVTALIEETQAAGQPVSASWLLRQSRYKELLRQVDAECEKFSDIAAGKITAGQRAAVQAGTEQARQLVLASLGEGAAQFAGTWNRVPTDALENLVGVLRDGSPLASLFETLGPESRQTIEKALITGIASGQGAAAIARQVRQGLGGNLTRALMISRTETLRAYREASIQSYAANGDVVEGWIWQATLTSRTCAMCIAMNGSWHSVHEPFGSHPNCRCVPLPHTKSWADLGIDLPDIDETRVEVEPGEDWFARQSEDVQKEILGEAKFAAWKAGKITLQDLVGFREDATWGPTRWERSLKSVLGNT